MNSHRVRVLPYVMARKTSGLWLNSLRDTARNWSVFASADALHAHHRAAHQWPLIGIWGTELSSDATGLILEQRRPEEQSRKRQWSPASFWLRCSIVSSTNDYVADEYDLIGAPGEIRTPDLLVRS